MSDFEYKAEQQWRARMVSQLKDAVRDLELVKAENAKLREENQYIGLIAYELGRKSLAEENAKLKELVRDMYMVMVIDAANCDVTYPEQFEGRMRELGIEIER